jgi:hypothetical protein
LPEPSPIIACPEKKRLLEEFARAVSDFNRMHSAQFAAALKGEDFPFEKELDEAMTRKLKAKDAVLAHQEEHGC